MMASTTCLVIRVKQPGIGRREEWSGKEKGEVETGWGAGEGRIGDGCCLASSLSSNNRRINSYQIDC